MNQYFRAIANNAADIGKTILVTDSEVRRIMPRKHLLKPGKSVDQSFSLPVIADVANGSSSGHINLVNKGVSRSIMSGEETTQDRQGGSGENEKFTKEDEYDGDLILPPVDDPEWMQKLEMDLAQASRLEEDLQMLCALRKQPPPDARQDRNENGDDDADSEFFPQKSNKRQNGKAKQPWLGKGKVHHNSRALDNLKIEGKNSFGIPCTDIYDDDFEEELNFLLRNHRNSRFGRSNTSLFDTNQAPAQLYLSGTSMGSRKMMAISSQIPMHNREDTLILRDEQTPLYADVTQVTPQKDVPSREVVKSSPTPTEHTGSGESTTGETVDSTVFSALSNGRLSQASIAVALSKPTHVAMPVTHNSHRTSMLGGSVQQKPVKTLRSSTRMCNTRNQKEQPEASESRISEVDFPIMSGNRSGRAPTRFCSSKSFIPRLWVSPAWPRTAYNMKQPFKQLRQAQRAASLPVPEGNETARKETSKRGRKGKDSSLTSATATAHVIPRKSAQKHDDGVNDRYWEQSNITRSFLVKTAPNCHQLSTTQLSLGSILSAIRSANEVLGYTK